VIAVLVVDTGPFDVELEMDAVAFGTNGEKFLGLFDRRGERILCVVDTFGPCKSARREFT
jgi:hypothetical protein